MNWKLHQLEWHICVLLQEKERKRQRKRRQRWGEGNEIWFGFDKRLVSESKRVSNYSIT